MEKQTNNEVVPNIGTNEIKPKKKKSKVFFIIAVLVVLLVSCGALLSSDDSSISIPTATEDQVRESIENQTSIDTEATPTEKEEEEKPITEAEPEEEEEATVNTPDSTAGLGRGSLIQYDKANVVVIDAGIMINEIEDTILYVNMEVENTSDEVLYFGRSNFYLYIDDYQVDTYSANRASDDFSLHDIEINSGRKSKYTYTAYIPNDYASAQKIEVEFPGEQVLYIVKDGEYLWDQEQTDDREHDGDGIVGEYNQIENPTVTMTITMDPAESCFIMYVDFHDGRNTMMGYLDSGMIIDYFTEDIDGFYEYNETEFILNSCVESDADGHYRK